MTIKTTDRERLREVTRGENKRVDLALCEMVFHSYISYTDFEITMKYNDRSAH